MRDFFIFLCSMQSLQYRQSRNLIYNATFTFLYYFQLLIDSTLLIKHYYYIIYMTNEIIFY
ncbi:hypothetical protein C1646_714633 [Rhizophagus diaphanus]|nr:hypothetical protein C1646_714633 [Rhizophagus diaphanus] [Rhizophagus sp. MUCL 43196]